MNINQISDADILEEFRRRFSLNGKTVVISSQSAINHLRGYFVERDREYFVVMFLSANNTVLATRVMFRGSITSSAVYPREILKAVLETGAKSVILAHNHPSGTNYPSNDDKRLTDKIVEGLKLFDVQVLDHILLSGDRHYSFADHGLIY